MKVSRAAYNCVFNILVAVIMSVMMSFVLTIVNVGVVPGFLALWLKSFAIAVIVAIPVTFATIPLVSRLLRFMKVQ